MHTHQTIGSRSLPPPNLPPLGGGVAACLPPQAEGEQGGRTRQAMAYTLFLLMLCTVVLTGFGFSSHKKLQPEGNQVRIPVTQLQTQKAVHYRVQVDGREIRFFAVRGSDGTIRTALDACDACYRQRKGYEQKGTAMICRNCNMAFPVDRIGPASVGGCNPHYLPSRLEGTMLVVAVDELRKGARYFP